MVTGNAAASVPYKGFGIFSQLQSSGTWLTHIDKDLEIFDGDRHALEEVSVMSQRWEFVELANPIAMENR